MDMTECSKNGFKCNFWDVRQWVTQSVIGIPLRRQQAPMVFSLYLVYLSTAACISEKNKVGSMLADF